MDKLIRNSENYSSVEFKEGKSITKPPMFEGSNFKKWKIRMMHWIKAQDYRAWMIIEKGPIKIWKDVEGQRIEKPWEEYTGADFEIMSANEKAMVLLTNALNPVDASAADSLNTAQEVWEYLQNTYEGTKNMRLHNRDRLIAKYEDFHMSEGEPVQEMRARFMEIVNELSHLGTVYPTYDLIRKILRALPDSWSTFKIVTESQDLENMKLETLMSNMYLHEEDRKTKGLLPIAEKKNVALKSKVEKKKTAVAPESEESSSSSELDQEKLALYVRKIVKHSKKKSAGKRSSDKPKWEQIRCFNCNKPGHIKDNCPDLKKSKSRSKKEKVMLTWTDSEQETDSESEPETSQKATCLMAHTESSEHEVTDSDTASESERESATKRLIFDLAGRLKEAQRKCKSLKEDKNQLVLRISDLENREKELAEESRQLGESKKDMEARIRDLEETCSKFGRGTDKLNHILVSQLPAGQKTGLGYPSTVEPSASLTPVFVAASKTVRCAKCSAEGHHSFECTFTTQWSKGKAIDTSEQASREVAPAANTAAAAASTSSGSSSSNSAQKLINNKTGTIKSEANKSNQFVAKHVQVQKQPNQQQRQKQQFRLRRAGLGYVPKPRSAPRRPQQEAQRSLSKRNVQQTRRQPKRQQRSHRRSETVLAAIEQKGVRIRSVWIPKSIVSAYITCSSNQKGPKLIWVPKSIHL